MRSRLALGGLAAAVLAGLVLPASAAPPAPPAAAVASASGFRRTFDPSDAGTVSALPPGLRREAWVSALVQLDAAPVAERTRTTGVSTATAVRSVSRQQDDAVPRLEAAGAAVLGRLTTVLNAVQVRVRARDLDRLGAVPGVRRVQVARVIQRANARSDQATTADETWDRLRLTGRGQVIGVVDTGVDYTHADFGGPGTEAAYERNDGATVERGTFPTRKVVGGYDFVGDAYDANSSGSDALPRPDRDPLDCGGHGSHVAGSAAGGGVTSSGRPYTGPYTEAALKGSFRVAPGAAPQATLRAYKVFGCEGGTSDDVVVRAVDRAVRDGVDVLNLSFAAPWGTAEDLQTQAVRAATAAGVLVVAAAGNDGPGAYLASTPATADSALAVAAVDSRATRSTVTPFTSGGPRRLDSAQKPDLAAPGYEVPSAAAGTGSRAETMSGTSMAAPHVAGVAALVRQAHPTWSPLRVKAVLVSTASATAVSGYDSRRLGTGLVQARRAASTRTYISTAGGLDSLRFGLNQLGGAYREKRGLVISNRSSSTVRYRLSATFSSARRGAALTFSPSTVTVRAGRSVTVAATLALSAAEVRALPGAAASVGGAVSTLHGVVVATPTSASAAHPVLRTTFLSVPVPLSAVTATPSVSAGATGNPGSITLTNTGPHAGRASLFQALLTDRAGDVESRETADITDVGVQTLAAPGGDARDRLVVFAVSQATGTSTHSTRPVALDVDVNGDGQADRRVFTQDTGLALDPAFPDGTLTSYTVDTQNRQVDSWTATAPANGSTVLLPVLASSLGVTSSSPPLRVTARGMSELVYEEDEVPGTGRYQPFHPALGQGGPVTVPARGTVVVPTRLDRTRLASQSAGGWLVVTPDDAAGREADRVRLQLRAAGSAAALRGR